MNLKYIRAIALASTVILFSGCAATVDVTKTAKGFFEATDPDHVQVLGTLPKTTFVELATFSTSGWDPSQTAKMHNAIRQKAAGVGANAVVILNSGVNNVSSGLSSRAVLWSTGVALKLNQ